MIFPILLLAARGLVVNHPPPGGLVFDRTCEVQLLLDLRAAAGADDIDGELQRRTLCFRLTRPHLADTAEGTAEDAAEECVPATDSCGGLAFGVRGTARVCRHTLYRRGSGSAGQVVLHVRERRDAPASPPGRGAPAAPGHASVPFEWLPLPEWSAASTEARVGGAEALLRVHGQRLRAFMSDAAAHAEAEGADGADTAATAEAGPAEAGAARAEAGATRGVVVAAGGVELLGQAWLAVSALRRRGSALPCEIWHWGEGELGGVSGLRGTVAERGGEPLAPHVAGDEAAAAVAAGWRAAFSDLGCECRDLQQALSGMQQRQQQHQHGRLAHLLSRHGVDLLCAGGGGCWRMKPFVAAFSRFDELLLLDADSVPLADPAAAAFGSAPYSSAGAVFWPDLFAFEPRRPQWLRELLGLSRAGSGGGGGGDAGRAGGAGWGWEHDSGQILLDKRRSSVRLALAMAMYLNGHAMSRVLGALAGLHGDKDTWQLAWRTAGAPFAQAAHLPAVVAAEGAGGGAPGATEGGAAAPPFCGHAMLQFAPEQTPLGGDAAGAPLHARLPRPLFVHGTLRKRGAVPSAWKGEAPALTPVRLWNAARVALGPSAAGAAGLGGSTAVVGAQGGSKLVVAAAAAAHGADGRRAGCDHARDTGHNELHPVGAAASVAFFNSELMHATPRGTQAQNVRAAGACPWAVSLARRAGCCEDAGVLLETGQADTRAWLAGAAGGTVDQQQQQQQQQRCSVEGACGGGDGDAEQPLIDDIVLLRTAWWYRLHASTAFARTAVVLTTPAPGAVLLCDARGEASSAPCTARVDLGLRLELPHVLRVQVDTTPLPRGSALLAAQRRVAPPGAPRVCVSVNGKRAGCQGLAELAAGMWLSLPRGSYVVHVWPELELPGASETWVVALGAAMKTTFAVVETY
jgi:hypothetical protein